MSADRDERADPLRQPPPADAQEQRQDETVVGPAERVSDAVPEASEADLAEQGVLVPPSDQPTWPARCAATSPPPTRWSRTRRFRCPTRTAGAEPRPPTSAGRRSDVDLDRRGVPEPTSDGTPPRE